MSQYYRRAGTWDQYLQKKSFVDDIRWEISKNGARVLGSLDSVGGRIETIGGKLETQTHAIREGFTELSRDIRAMDETLADGFVILHFDLQSVSRDLHQLTAKFEWGISELSLQIGHLADGLDALLAVARTPEQTWAFEQFDIARDAHRKRLYSDAIDYAERAINGYQAHTGYRLDYRPHYLLGLIHLGDRKSAHSRSSNPSVAEKFFLDAARYAEVDFRTDAAQAMCYASFAAYLQDAFDRAEEHAMKGIGLYNQVPELHFQLAKVRMAVNKVLLGLNNLRTAFELDEDYVKKAWADDDFTQHGDSLEKFTRELFREKLSLITSYVDKLSKTSEGYNLEIKDYLESIVGPQSRAAIPNLQSAAQRLDSGNQDLCGLRGKLLQLKGLYDTFAMLGELDGNSKRYYDSLGSAQYTVENCRSEVSAMPTKSEFLSPAAAILDLALSGAIGLGLTALWTSLYPKASSGLAFLFSTMAALFVIDIVVRPIVVGGSKRRERRKLRTLDALAAARDLLTMRAREFKGIVVETLPSFHPNSVTVRRRVEW
jgi:hypothetical protein